VVVKIDSGNRIENKGKRFYNRDGLELTAVNCNLVKYSRDFLLVVSHEIVKSME
jgi:hypothetical protein